MFKARQLQRVLRIELVLGKPGGALGRGGAAAPRIQRIEHAVGGGQGQLQTRRFLRRQVQQQGAVPLRRGRGREQPRVAGKPVGAHVRLLDIRFGRFAFRTQCFPETGVFEGEPGRRSRAKAARSCSIRVSVAMASSRFWLGRSRAM
ncbi:hypothetical protein LP420_16055 [Massilia sp. B-10]|nr:hypothetical protein LP420_16055 [Massilia sp. B-10]